MVKEKVKLGGLCGIIIAVNKMKDKGFTLVELIVVIAILGLLAGLASYSIVSILQRSQNMTSDEMENNLGDAAVTYGLAEIFLEKCTPGFQIKANSLSDPTNPTSSCFRKVKVSYLKDNGYFNDDGNHCNQDAEVYIYNYVEQANGSGEYRAYVPKGTCN